MSSVQQDIRDCKEGCKSVQHGNIITAAISRRSVSDYDLCCFLNYICTCCESVRDSAGRTALHVAASCGRLTLVRWLVLNRHADINARDEESNLTPLHRSIFYGKIAVAVELIKLGANINMFDSNYLTPLEHAMKDGLKPDNEIGGELYVWGSNTNNSLGPQQTRSIPELLDIFHKTFMNENVVQICIEKFHSIIITDSGNAYSCGHGHGGRLGLGSQNSVINPEKIKFPNNNRSEKFFCKAAAISRNHSLFLDSELSVYACGLNTDKILGVNTTQDHVLNPMQVKIPTNFSIKGICAGQYHSVVWGPKAIYTWGLNAGQLGQEKRNDSNYIIKPKAVKLLNVGPVDIVAVASSDAAIAVYSQRGDLYVLHEYQCTKIASRVLNIVQIDVFGGKLDTSVLNSEFSKEHTNKLKVVALTITGNIMLWQEEDPKLRRCIFSINRAIVVRQVKINANGLLFVTRDGEAFRATIRPRKSKNIETENKKMEFHRFLDQENCIWLDIIKISRIHRAIAIESDRKGLDFCVIQAKPYKMFKYFDAGESELKEQLRTLLQTCQENDNIHDIIFKINEQYFPAHRFILASRCGAFEKLFIDDEKLIELEGYNPLIFQQFLEYVYTNSCELLQSAVIPEKLRIPYEKTTDLDNNFELINNVENLSAFAVYNSNKSMKQKAQKQKENLYRNPIKMLQEMARKFGCNQLYKLLNNYEVQKFNIIRKKDIIDRGLSFNHMGFEEFSDVTIVCADNKQIMAHKCMLAMQCDYFDNLFSARWNGAETNQITLPCSRSIARSLLEFLYTGEITCTDQHQDHLFKLLVLADHLFLEKLKLKCESMILKSLTLKTCIYILTFSHYYNAEHLKKCCLKFIVHNITPILELRLLDNIENELLDDITEFYFQEISQISYRVITPYSTAPLEEEILSISTTYPISLDEEVERIAPTPKTSKRRSRNHKSNSFTENNVKSNDDSIKLKMSENEIQFPDSPKDNVGTNVINRLKAIKLAESKLEDDCLQSQYINLNEELKKDDCDILGSSFEEFPLLNSPPSSSYISKSHKNENSSSRHKIVRISQKQRKRLSSETTPEIIPESPKNPWKILPEVCSSTSPVQSKMSDIITSEKKQKDNLVKIQRKSLIYTQMEDKAIEDLKKFYNANEILEELIIVERVSMGVIAAPVWVPGVKKLN